MHWRSHREDGVVQLAVKHLSLQTSLVYVYKSPSIRVALVSQATQPSDSNALSI